MTRPRLSEAPYVAALVAVLFLVFLAAAVIARLPPLTPPGGFRALRKALPMNGNLNPAAVSKINWTAGLAFVVAVCAVFGFAIPDEFQKSVLEITAVGSPFLTVILRTFFTGKASS